MIVGWLFIVTFIAVLGSGIMAGLFFVFSAFMMTALSRLPAAQGIAAMQSINVAIINPVFLTVFMGTAVLCALLIAVAFFRWADAGSAWLLAGGVLYLIGVIVVTMVVNVPMNDAIAAADPASAEGAALWTRYLNDWVMWNHVRTASSIAALASLVLALR